MDPRRLLAIGRRWALLPVIGAMFVGILVYALTSAQPSVYESQATLKLGQAVTGSPILVTQVADRLLAEYAYRATTQDTLEDVIAELGLGSTVTELGRDVNADFEPASALLTITARAESAELAAAIANSVGSELIALGEASQGSAKVQQALTDDLDALRSQIERTRTNIAELGARPNPNQEVRDQLAALEGRLVALITASGEVLDRLVTIGAHELEFVAEAVPPESKIEPRPALFAALAAAAALMLLVGVVAAVEYFDESLRSPEQISAATGLPTLGVVTELEGDARAGAEHRLVMLRRPRSASAEEYRRLRATIDALAESVKNQSLVVTGTVPPIGKSVVAANLAIAFAEAGRRVVLVDAALRQPQVHALFSLPNERGLSSLLAYPSTPLSYLMTTTRVAGLSVIPAGKWQGTPRSLGPEHIDPLIRQLLRDHDLVIFDGPAVPSASDALTLSHSAKRTLLVLTEKRTSQRSARDALDALALARADVLGIALFGQKRGSRVGEGTAGSVPPVQTVPAGKTDPQVAAPAKPRASDGRRTGSRG